MTRKVLSGGEPYRLELIGGRAYHLAGGGSCIAIDAGTNSPLAGNSCTKCGKAIVPSGVASSPGSGRLWARQAGPRGRLLRQWAYPMGACGETSAGLAILWMISGILRLNGSRLDDDFRQDVYSAHAGLDGTGRRAVFRVEPGQRHFAWNFFRRDCFWHSSEFSTWL